MSGNEMEEFLDSVLRNKVSELDRLMEYEMLSARAEGKSQKTIETTLLALRKLRYYLYINKLPTDAQLIQAEDIRLFILKLQASPRYANHPYIGNQSTTLSPISINCYLRSIRAAFNRWVAEGFIDHSPFEKVRVPKAPKKVIPTFSLEQIEALLGVIDTATAVGFRNSLMIILYLDTACRLTEITNLKLSDVNLIERCLKIVGKGQKERIVPIGVTTQKLLWKYMNVHRPEPALPRFDHVFLTRGGRPMTKTRVEAMMKGYGRKAGISGVRCSPHTIRHTSCVMWVKNGGDLFSLQRITGHSSLEVLRGYVNLAQGDILAAHQRYSAVDNLDLKATRKRSGAR